MSTPLPPVANVVGCHSPEGEELREVFSRSLSRTRGSAQLFVSVRGQVIADLAGGAMTTDTPVQVFSVSKLVVALAAAHAHASGVLNLDVPLADYWAAFDRSATRKITARMVLDHSSGICAVSRPLSTENLLAGALEAEVAVQDPFWEPGTQHGYSAFTFGALMAGVFQNAAGISVQEYVARHITGPLGAGFWFGAPTEVLPRLVKLTFDPPILTEAQAAAIVDRQAIPDGSFIPILENAPAFFADPRVQQAAWPAVSGVSTAAELGRILNAALGFGVEKPLLAGADLDAMISQRRHGPDRTLHHVSRYGSGVELPHIFFPYLGGRSFGHQGAGGSVLAADPDSGTVFAYTCSHSASTVGGSDQALALLSAVRLLIEKTA
ncbi:serine hydrolase domain-containing protein [Paraburkholderia tropica]|uniref:serine hydrolase domain-containing protein n=1 Tax=Paraburkholderia tropica TaxID=92647 RepID=UPI002AB2EDAD|nr:serine hydrolase domain-containing protein [Paraburkholderia tropica]